MFNYQGGKGGIIPLGTPFTELVGKPCVVIHFDAPYHARTGTIRTVVPEREGDTRIAMDAAIGVDFEGGDYAVYNFRHLMVTYK